MNSGAKIVKTKDGTDTLYLPDLDEYYHSIHGARQESEHVYIKMGLDFYHKNYPDKKEIKIMEVGFGTGLNAMLTHFYAKENQLKIYYTTLEPYPLKWDLIRQIDFKMNAEEKLFFEQLHICKWNEEEVLDEHFTLMKKDLSLENLQSSENQFNIIYFDAFAPNKQEKIWSSGNFRKLFFVLEADFGILVTYCARGMFKRTAKEAGFSVTNLQGPPGKREMVRLVKKM